MRSYSALWQEYIQNGKRNWRDFLTRTKLRQAGGHGWYRWPCKHYGMGTLAREASACRDFTQ
jgi:hypothetical protein